MKASVTKGLGQGFAVEDITIGDPVGHEVRIAVKASGLCHSDLSVATFIGGEFPVVLGHEVAGEVVEVGPLVSQVKVGDHVVGSLIQYCGSCVNCLGGRSYICLRPEATLRGADQASRLSWNGAPVAQGMGLGGFAQEVLVHENQLAVVPDEMPWAPAALLGCGVLTGAGAVLRSAEVRQGDTVVVIGAGGVGLNAVNGARLAGAEKIIVTDLEDVKLDRARAFGATHVVNSRTADPVEAVRDITGHGADHVFDFVGVRPVTAQAMQMLGRGGGLYLIGVGGMDAGVDVSALTALTYSQKVQGVYMGSSEIKRDLPFYASMYLQGRMNLDDLITKRIALDEIDAGYESLTDPSSGRVVITDLS
ncbi:zinc-binding dehydrogenase [Actinoplanes couchii]|uniref:Alcohol dehydrogenase n=1 Tax=Actinoplanes couchii TaxID=403638 RepID=A0ABQ3X8Q8_9ACTN|nr:zinc-binding dehydrogenase [Actinoplanes couchii]MDR6320102.1 S-(hydroxymethyl)glutathione dehydrogenase/alcohol dehydrogenase [Actinoplanes couchii]GID54883.1 alcohol dehydrogenase [Actinoplanes couchii]